jgi:formate dehydrogenase major subunit
MLYHIFKNGWEDKQYINDRVYGMDKVREDVMAKWTPDKVEEVCGVPEATVYKVAEMMAKNRPSTVVWCMGQTQHTTGNALVRTSCILQLALGNVGVSGGGTNIFRGHDNVQGATDVGPNPDSLPAYYGLAAGSWKHWAAVWGVPYEWIQKQYAPGMMEKPGMTVSRWIDGVLEKNELIDQDSNLRALVFWGHAPNSQTRGKEMVEAMKKLDLLVVHRPVSVGHRGDGGDGAQGRRLPVAGGVAARDLGIVHRIEPVAAMARALSLRRCSSRRPTTRSCMRSPRNSVSAPSSSRTTRS